MTMKEIAAALSITGGRHHPDVAEGWSDFWLRALYVVQGDIPFAPNYADFNEQAAQNIARKTGLPILGGLRPTAKENT